MTVKDQIIENDFLTQSKKGKNDWWRISLFVATLIALPTIASLIVDHIQFPEFADKERELAMYIAIDGFAFSIVLFGVFLAIKLIHKRSFSTLNGRGPSQLKEFCEGILVWGFLIVVGSLINHQEEWRYFIDNGLNSSLIIILPVVLIAIGIQSYAEEVIFRGYLLQTLSLRVKNVSLLIIVSSTMFGILHGLDGLAAIVGTTMFGCLFCYIVLKRNSLAFAAGVHLMHNFLFIYVIASRNLIENDDFLEFDLMEYSILIGQFVLLYAYIRYKDHGIKDKSVLTGLV